MLTFHSGFPHHPTLNAVSKFNKVIQTNNAPFQSAYTMTNSTYQYTDDSISYQILSHQIHYRSYWFLRVKWPNQQCQSTEV